LRGLGLGLGRGRGGFIRGTEEPRHYDRWLC
jgi:hypothetical protein